MPRPSLLTFPLPAWAATPPPVPPPPRPVDPTRYAAAALHELAGWVGRWWLPAGVPLVALAVVGWLAYRRLQTGRHAVLVDGARTVDILSPPQVSAQAAAVFWGQLTGLLRPRWQRLLHGQPHLGWELRAGPTGISIRLWVPGPIPPHLVERAVQAAWPGTRTSTGPAVPPLPAGGLAVGGRLRLARPDVLPLRADPAGDPVAALLAATGELNDGETAAVQILARPVTGRRLTRARRDAARVRGHDRPTALSGMWELLTPRTRRRPAGPAGPTPPEDSAASRAIGAKAVQPRWETAVLYAAATDLPAGRGDRADRQAVVGALRGRVHAIAATFALYAGHNYLRRLRLTDPVAVLAGRRLRRGDLLAVDELAALAHLPYDGAIPGLARAGSAAVAPPAGIPAGGWAVKVLGDSDAGRRRPVGVTVADARHHVHIVGATGSGKSTLLGNMILDDVAGRRGLVVIDPKGDLINDLLDRIPADAADRVVLIDPADSAPPPCLNILDGGDPELTTDQLVGIFRRIWADSWGPRTDDLLRAACLTLLTSTRPRRGRPRADSDESPVPTLLDVLAVLTDAAYQREVLRGMKDPVLIGFWSWYTSLSDGARAQAIGPILNKLRALLLRKFVRSSLAAGPSTVHLGDILDRGGILLVRIPKGQVGEDACQILGSIVLAKVWQHTLQRANRPPARRPDASCYLDECQNFLTLPGAVEDMLAEARGYRLSLTLAHQHQRQLPADLADALGANARTKVIFTCSPRDATSLARHVSPVLSDHDLAHLPAYTAALRLVVNAADTPAFTACTRPLPPPVPGRATQLRTAARRAAGPDPEKPGTAVKADPRARPVTAGNRRNRRDTP